MLDPGSLRHEDSSFVSDGLEEKHGDLLFSALLGDGPVRVYVPLEHQSTVDSFMPFRIHRYTTRIWDRWLAANPSAKKLPPVYPLVLFQGPRAWTGPRRLSDIEREASREVADVFKSTAETLIEKGLRKGRKEGRTEGRKEGREEGREEGSRKLLARLLRAKFGKLSPAIKERLASARLKDLERWAGRTLAASTLDDVFE